MIHTIALILAIATTAPGATGCASRTIHSDEGLWVLAGECLEGAIADVLASGDGGGAGETVRGVLQTTEVTSFTVDGVPPAYWLARYAGQRRPERVGWSFRFRFRGLIVERQTEFRTGQVTLTTDAWGEFNASRRLRRVQLEITASSVQVSGTRVAATAWATTDTCLGRRIISRSLADALADAESTARRAHAGGHQIADAFLRRVYSRGLR